MTNGKNDAPQQVPEQVESQKTTQKSKDAEKKEKERDQETDKTKPQVEALIRALVEEKKNSEDYLTRLKYLQADYDNLRKRVDKQIEDIRKYSNEALLCSLLEVSDELELALKSARASKNSDALVQGVEMTLKKLNKIMENDGISQIDCACKQFDPSKHMAFAKVECEDVDEGVVVEEIRKGYTMKEKVIRPSIVKVAVKPSKLKSLEENSNEQ
jgi:molecular chaperone GrpE